MLVAGIVAFEPDIDRLKLNIKAILPQVDKLIISWNSEAVDRSHLVDAADEMSKLVYIDNGGNKGIAYALNKICAMALDLGAKNCLLLDDDSVVPEGMISKYEEKTAKDIAILCPNICDEDSKQNETFEQDEYVKFEITSGSYVNLDIWKKVKGFDNKLFIDFVDWDYCLKVDAAGYYILKVADLVLNHKLGEVSYHKLFGKRFQTYNHSAFRKYYITRNTLVMHKRYPDCEEFQKPRLKILKRAMIVILWEKDKRAKLSGMKKGVKDSKKFSKKTK